MTVYDEIDYLHTLDVDDPLAREIVRVADLKSQIDALDAERKMLSERIIKQLAADGHRNIGVTTPQGERMRATVVRATTTDVNLVQLEEINEDLYINVTKRVLDSAKLTRALNTNQFSEAELHTIRIVDKAPYLRFSPIIEGLSADE